MIYLVSNLLSKPWKYTEPYITGSKSSASFRAFIIHHINELSDPNDLKVMKKNIAKNCKRTKHPICQQLINQIDKSLSLQ